VQEALGIVIFVVVGVAVVAAVASLFVRYGGYDHIGRGGLSVDPPPAGAAEREAEIEQMLAAHNARRAARGQAPLEVGALAHPAADAGLREELVALVQARNARRVKRGEPPLAVEAEVERRLRELGG
jgi:hypothetical protein